MNNNSFPFVIVSAVLIVASIALFYFLALPQFEKISMQEKEMLDLEYKLENTTSYFNIVNENVQKLEELEWEKVSKKIDANFMAGPFFIHNMEAYFKNLIIRSGLYLKDLKIEGASEKGETQQQVEGEANTTVAENTTKQIGISFDLSGEYDYLRNLLDIFDKQALVVKIENIEISNSSSGMSESGNESGEYVPASNNSLSFKIKASISSK